MYFVELMRARRVLFWYVLALAALLVIVVFSLYAGHADTKSGEGSILLSWLLAGCGFGALIVATLMAPGLNAEAATTAITWTRPVPRDKIAWEFVAIDVATIALGYAATLITVLLVFAIAGLAAHVKYDLTEDLVAAALTFGGVMMWYALISVAAARLPGRGPLVAGLSWGVFVIGGGLVAAPFPPVIHVLIVALNYLNPLAYIGGSTNSGNHSHVIPWGPEGRAVAAWAIAAVALFFSTRLWSTREA